MFNKRTILGLFIAAAAVAAWILPHGTAAAEDPHVRPLATLANAVRTDFPNAVEFHLMYVGVPNPQTVDIEFSIEPDSFLRRRDHPLRAVPRKDHDHLAVGTLRGQAFPPGHTVRWRWRVTGVDGSVRMSYPREFVWTDERFEWQSYVKDELTVHWYNQYPEFGEHLVGFLEPQLERIEPLGTTRNPVNVFIYESSEDADPGAVSQRDDENPYRAFNTVVSVIPEEIQGDELIALIHELAHFIVQDRGFNCFNGLPHWLEEGLAILAEGGLSDEMRRAFAEARLIEQFIPLRSFDVPFSPNTEETAVQYPHSQDKLVRYAQSYSLVEVLMEEFGWEKIGFLIDLFKYGITVDDALKLAFGLDTEETEKLWRIRAGLPELAPNRVLTPGADGGG